MIRFHLLLIIGIVQFPKNTSNSYYTTFSRVFKAIYRTNLDGSEQRLLFHDFQFTETKIFSYKPLIFLPNLADTLEDGAVGLETQPLCDLCQRALVTAQEHDLPVGLRKRL